MTEPPGRTVRPMRTPICCTCAQGPHLHKHEDGSHWCLRCWGYAGYVGENGIDWHWGDGTHPQDCDCPPCPCMKQEIFDAQLKLLMDIARKVNKVQE